MKLLSSRWYVYILFLELWEVPVKKKSKIVGALLVGSRLVVGAVSRFYKLRLILIPSFH